MYVINPGSGVVAEGSKEQSELNIKSFIEDLGVDAKYEFLEVLKDGRHDYRIWNDEYSHKINMPALSLDKVRYIQGTDQSIWDFPRLYVDGSSWIWCFALGMCFQD